VLCEAGLLPGALLPNVERRFICRQVNLEVVRATMPFTADCWPGELLSIPVKHTTGRYYAPPDDLERLEAHGQILRQRLRAHAPPRARRRPAHRLRRRAEDLLLDGPCPRLSTPRRSG
jgi:phosphoribosylformylglycinamidine (FGAM) synthase-like amidotransferase family enzyme